MHIVEACTVVFMPSYGHCIDQGIAAYCIALPACDPHPWEYAANLKTRVDCHVMIVENLDDVHMAMHILLPVGLADQPTLIAYM